MNRQPIARLAQAGLLLLGTATFLGCAENSLPPGPAEGINAAAGGGGKPISGPSVTAANPSYGHEGDVSKQVALTGSGFAPGAQAAWERDGIVDAKIQVLSTQYVSSTQLVATITITQDAAISLYDVSVTNPDKKKGIGYALFEVTEAIVVDGTTVLHWTNSNGEMVGGFFGSGSVLGDARYWSQGTGLVALTSGTVAWAIDEAGNTITGNAAGGTGGFIPIWTRVGGSWVMGSLPMDPAAVGGNGRGIASDALTGNAIFIAGVENYPGKGKTPGGRRPRVWRLGVSGWERVVLTSLGTDGNDVVEEISRNGVAVGTSAGHATVWEPNGLGGYTVSALPGSATGANGINSAGDLIVGVQNGVSTAYYWQRLPSGGWSAAQTLPIACNGAIDVDDAGRIAANDCVRSSGATSPAVFAPPYTGTPLWLGGLGKNNGGHVEAMSLTGGWLAGQAGVGVYWKLP